MGEQIKILLGGCGGAPTENVIDSWRYNLKAYRKGRDDEILIGIGSEPYDLMMSNADKLFQVPYAEDPLYENRLFKIIKAEKPSFAHFQHDSEIRIVSRMREKFQENGVKLYMPSKETIEVCVDKSRSAEIWKREGVKIPQTMIIQDDKDLKRAFEKLGNNEGMIWIRSIEASGGGKGALPTNNYDFARMWIDQFRGWGNFTAAELLTKNTVTWLSLWYEGELVVAQSRRRISWGMGNRTLSGVTGITHVGETFSDDMVNRVAMDAIFAIDRTPHGIFGVDMAYDNEGIPNPTEINIARFFTTVFFFAKAGLNIPKIYKDIALYQEFPTLKRKINPLPDGLLWIRGMDREPILTRCEDIKKRIDLTREL